MALFGIKQAAPEVKSIEFWDCHQGAVDWWIQVQDLMRYQERFCLGLDIVAIKADADMSGREFEKDDYLKLRIIAQTVTKILNEEATQ